MSAAARGFAVTVIATALFATALTLLLAVAIGGMPQLNANAFAFPLQVLMIFTVAACGSMLLIGLPVTYLLSKWGAEKDWTYAVCGAIAGSVVASIFVGALSLALSIPIGAMFGAFAGLIWWYAYRKKAVVREEA